jgi:hypothetical protein
MFFPIPRANLIISAPLLGIAVLFFTSLLGGAMWLGIFLSVLAMVVDCLGKLGIEIRNGRKAYRNCFMLFGWRVGQWQPLPSVIGITLKYFSYMEKGNSTPSGAMSWGIWNNRSQRHEELVVMLSLENSKIGLIINRFELDDVNKAIDVSHDIADFFDVPVHQFLPPTQFQPINPT